MHGEAGRCYHNSLDSWFEANRGLPLWRRFTAVGEPRTFFPAQFALKSVRSR